MVLGAFATILLVLCTLVLKAIWNEIKSVRDRVSDHGSILADHDGQLETHAEDIRSIKSRVFNGGGRT
jgi:hypothetical protein